MTDEEIEALLEQARLDGLGALSDVIDTKDDQIAINKHNLQTMVDGFVWMANISHQTQHKAMIDQGQTSFMECDAKTCKYAKSIIDWHSTL